MTNPAPSTPAALRLGDDPASKSHRSSRGALAGPRDEPPREPQAQSPQDAAEESSKQEPAPVESGSDEAGQSTAARSDDSPKKGEPLTPELVEEEAQRGDFVLRVAVLLLALLLGCAEVAETETLVHIKTGQYLAAHGWLPPETDVFSYTAEDRRWVNLSWLFDLLLAGVYFAGDVGGVIVLKAVLAAAMIYFVLRCTRPNISTWWGSVIAGMILLIAYPQFTALPELITLLGLALVLWIVHRWQCGAHNALWWLVPLFLLWSNLDGRMFLGLSALLLYAAGELIDRQLRRRPVRVGPEPDSQSPAFSGGDSQSSATGGRTKQLWTITALCLVAACGNPFGWNSLLAPITLYGRTYPILQEYYPADAGTGRIDHFPLYNLDVLRTPHALVAIILLLAAGATLLLNRQRVTMAHLLLYFGFAGFAVFGSHELAAAAVVGGVLATLNAQQWYAANFSQSYSVDVRERRFSNGGRAVTVVGLFLIGFLAAGGRLSDPNARRVGFGFQGRLQTTLSGLAADIEGAFDNRPFNFTPRQGDLLIWLGRDVFIDSRVALFDGSGYSDLVTLHQRTRQSVRRRRKGDEFSGRREIWTATLDRFSVTHVLPSLSPPDPDYVTFLDLLLRWELVRPGSATAVFYRPDLPSRNPLLAEYLDGHRFNFVAETFREDVEAVPPRPDWPRRRSFFQNLLYRPVQDQPASLQAARHQVTMLSRLFRDRQRRPVNRGLVVAVAHRVIRLANRALVDDPDSAEAFRLLGDAYSILGQIEPSIGRAAAGQPVASRRYFQTTAAYGQAVMLEPDVADVQYALAQAYRGRNRLDLELQALRRYDELTDYETSASDEEQRHQTDVVQRTQQLEDEVQLRLQQIDQQLNSPNAAPLAVARFADGLGCAKRALEILQRNNDATESRFDGQLLLGRLLLEAGRAEDAAVVFAQLQGAAEQQDLTGWQQTAAFAHLAGGGYEPAVQIWNQWREQVIQRQLRPALTEFVISGPTVLWTPFHSQLAGTLLRSAPPVASQILVQVALSHLETGENEEAEKTLRRILGDGTESDSDALAAFYLVLITGNAAEALPSEQAVPLEPHDMFYSAQGGPEREQPADQ